jgi:DNA-binding transcriptional LysR family regulator
MVFPSRWILPATARRQSDPAFFDYVLVQQQRAWLAISNQNPLGAKDKIKMVDLSGENSCTGSNDFSHSTSRWPVLKLGYCPRADYLSDDIRTLIDLVALNKGIYILPEFKLDELRRPDIKFYYLEDVPPIKYYLITKKGRDLSPAVMAFRDFLIDNQERFMAKV